jgi:L-cysteine desulfidase
MSYSNFIIELLTNEVRPAIGCTEPVAVALCTAYGTELLGEEPKKITVFTSKSIYKNGMDVGIPGTKKTGLDVAAALGAALKDSSKGLELLGDVTDEKREMADKYLQEYSITVDIADTDRAVYIEALLESEHHHSRALILDRHDHLVELSLDGKDLPLVKKVSDTGSISKEEKEKFYHIKLQEIAEVIEGIPAEKLYFLLEGLEMNKKTAALGINERYGLGVGFNMQKNIDEGLVAQDLANLAFVLTAAASDVRMSGERVSVMSSSGSGNNGLTAILPLAALQDIRPLDDDALVRALAISHTITSYVKHYIGRLSNLCGCSIAAAIGSGSAIAWVLGGKGAIAGTVNNIIANQAGVICDGAKPGCALKLGTAAMTAVQAALLSIKGTVIEDPNGLADPCAEKSIENLATLSSNGMSNVDRTIIDIMQNRGNQ